MTSLASWVRGGVPPLLNPACKQHSPIAGLPGGRKGNVAIVRVEAGRLCKLFKDGIVGADCKVASATVGQNVGRDARAPVLRRAVLLRRKRPEHWRARCPDHAARKVWICERPRSNQASVGRCVPGPRPTAASGCRAVPTGAAEHVPLVLRPFRFPDPSWRAIVRAWVGSFCKYHWLVRPV